MLFMLRPRCLQGLGVRPLSRKYGTYDTESSLAFQIEVFKIFQGVPSSLERGTPAGFHWQSIACMLQSRRFFLRTRRLRGCWRLVMARCRAERGRLARFRGLSCESQGQTALCATCARCGCLGSKGTYLWAHTHSRQDTPSVSRLSTLLL